MQMNDKLSVFKKNMKGAKIAVIGVGISNRPLIRYIYSLGAQVTAFDALPYDDNVLKKTMEDFASEGIHIEWSCGTNYLDILKDGCFAYIFKTPKIRSDHPALQEAISRGSILTSEMEIFMELCPAKIFAVTGSDGKTTTTTLISLILRHAGYKVYVGGNIGTPLLDQIDSIQPDSMVVLELSSFQLLSMRKSADVAVITNVTPNHLDFHKDYQEYIASKMNLFLYQSFQGRLVLNGDNAITNAMHMLARGNRSYFSWDKDVTLNASDDKLIDHAYVNDGIIEVISNSHVTKICKTSDILIPGKHNVENYLAAICAVLPYVDVSDITDVARKFTGVEHRIELVRTLDDVRYFNSSIDTSPNRTINTMNALQGRGEHGVLIAGGADKKCNYDGLGTAILAVCDRIVLYGDNAELIIHVLQKEANGQKYCVFQADNYKEALQIAREQANAGEIIILSPTGTSYDHFRHFEERGNLFKDLVMQLT